MDLLDQVHQVAGPLLDRVDAALSTVGAPAGHPIWPLLRRLGVLPGELVAHLATLTPAGLTGASDAVRGHASGYRHRVDEVPMPAAWRGPAAQAYGAAWSALSAHVAGGHVAGGHVAGGPDTLTGRLDDTARYLDEVAAWIGRSRRALAGTLAECLGSAEALAIRASGAEQPVAAATIGAHVLGTAAEILDDGQALHDRWTGRLAELIYRPPVPARASTAQLQLG